MGKLIRFPLERRYPPIEGGEDELPPAPEDVRRLSEEQIRELVAYYAAASGAAWRAQIDAARRSMGKLGRQAEE